MICEECVCCVKNCYGLCRLAMIYKDLCWICEQVRWFVYNCFDGVNKCDGLCRVVRLCVDLWCFVAMRSQLWWCVKSCCDLRTTVIMCKKSIVIMFKGCDDLCRVVVWCVELWWLFKDLLWFVNNCDVLCRLVMICKGLWWFVNKCVVMCRIVMCVELWLV